MLYRYAGPRTREHFGENGQPHSLRHYGSDLSDSKVYHFNSLGFRGEEFDPDAKVKIFVCGSSFSFGTGLDFEETFGYLFKTKFAQKYGHELDDICLMNFAEGGSSNDYVSRTLLAQCSVVQPDLLIAEFVFKNRTEAFLDGHPFQIGPWTWQRWFRRIALACRAPRGRKKEILQRLTKANHYYKYYTDEQGFMNSIRNILLIQSFCQANNIRCILSWIEHDAIHDKKYRDDAVIAPMIQILDKRRFCDFGIRDPDILVDLAGDELHPGPKSQDIYAQRLLEFYESTSGPLP